VACNITTVYNSICGTEPQVPNERLSNKISGYNPFMTTVLHVHTVFCFVATVGHQFQFEDASCREV
jgi:hypothetical protein